MPDSETTTEALSPGAASIVETVRRIQRDTQGPPGTNRWLLALLERHGPMAQSLARDLDPTQLRRYLTEQVQAGTLGEPLDIDNAIADAVKRAIARGKTQASERDLAAVILASAGYTLIEQPLPAAPASSAAPTSDTEGAPTQPASSYSPRARRPTPTLDQFGRDVTRAALEGKLLPVVGRDAEIELTIETLCRRTKRNPVLVGAAGVGKTAIVEGLAQRVVRGEVPALLQNERIIELQPSSLVAGAGIVGELNERMKAILAEASQDGIILFIDEVHSVVGAGGMQGTGDVASLLKPALARGDLACIAATTDNEYRRFIEPDTALERRFQPIRIQEITREQTVDVLQAVSADLERTRGVHVPEEVLHWLVDFADQYLRNRTFPDKAIDLLEQCVAYARTHDKNHLDLADAAMVAQRMVGMPLELDERLAALREILTGSGPLTIGDAQALVDRLGVTVRGLDVRVERPDAVVLLLGDAAQEADTLAGAISGALFGDAERVVRIDFGRMANPADITMLIGAPPGYVGYSDTLPIHRVTQIPWCVLLCEHVDACHPQIADILAQALSDGFLTDAQGRRIYLSDAVVLVTADMEGEQRHRIGFTMPGDSPTQAEEERREIAARVLPERLVDAADVIAIETRDSSMGTLAESDVLAELSHRYHKLGVEIRWDPTLLEWLKTQAPEHASQREWERLVDRYVSSNLGTYLSGKTAATLVVGVRDGSIDITEAGKE